MALNSTNPLYSEFITDWITMRDTYRGERIVKDKGEAYLPATGGMKADGMNSANAIGYQAYKAYKERAVFHDFVSDAVEAMIGMMHHKPPVIELPSVLEDMRKNATITGESLEQLLRRINEEQLVTGRLGLLLDLPQNPDPTNPLPYIVSYRAEDIINWDDGARGQMLLPQLNLVVLNESEYERTDEFEWELVEKYRALILGDVEDNENSGVYRTGVFRKNLTFTEEALIEPSIRGSMLDKIPFTFINTKDIVSCPDDPPLIGLAKLALAIYRGEADYRQNLFMQGQDTLVITGGNEEEYRVGTGAVINLPNSESDAKFIGVTSDGLAEQRQSLENDKAQAVNKAGQMIDTRSRQKESGDALKIRLAAQTATLNQIALTGAAGLESTLRMAAEWLGANPDEVNVTPNLDFVDDELTGKTLVEYMSAKAMGAPLSNKSVHSIIKNRGLTEMEYEEEISEIENEGIVTGTGTNAGGDADDDS